jgi:hypothetical protein
MGNIISTIHDEENYQLSKHPRPALGQIPEYRLEDVRSPAGWTRDKDKLERRIKRWQQKKKYNSKAYEFLTSRALVMQHVDADPWEATELLGAGAFGQVGLWQQLDRKTGAILDSLAIKQTMDDEPKGYIEIFQRKNGKEPIPSEALWMNFLSRRTMYIPSLRQLVHFRGTNSKRWRFYMEYCPHGTVTDLIKLYKEYNDNHEKRDE